MVQAIFRGNKVKDKDLKVNLEVCNMGQPIVTLIVFNRSHSEWIFGNNIGRLRFSSKQTVNY